MAFLFLQGLFLIYLFLALFVHRKDRKALERIAISKEVDVLFRYSWRGVELKISHPTDRSKGTPTPGNPPPSPPLGDWAGKVNLYPGGTHGQREEAGKQSDKCYHKSCSGVIIH